MRRSQIKKAGERVNQEEQNGHRPLQNRSSTQRYTTPVGDDRLGPFVSDNFATLAFDIGKSKLGEIRRSS
jgi:hypothetical protein